MSEPVTTSGWYENDNGTVSKYVWRAGQLCCDATVAGWADVPASDAPADEPTRSYRKDD